MAHKWIEDYWHGYAKGHPQEEEIRSILADAPLPEEDLMAPERVRNYQNAMLSSMAKEAGTRRCQPPMVERQRLVLDLVERFEAEGIPFGVGPNSRMNKAVLKSLHELAAQQSSDQRKSRRKKITPGAVRQLLKTVRLTRYATALFLPLIPKPTFD